MNVEEIKERLIKNFPGDKVEAFDLRGSGDHFSIIVISLSKTSRDFSS